MQNNTIRSTTGKNLTMVLTCDCGQETEVNAMSGNHVYYCKNCWKVL